MSFIINFFKDRFSGNSETDFQKMQSHVFLNWINNYFQNEQITITNIYELIDKSYMKTLVEMIWNERIDDNFNVNPNSNEFKMIQFHNIINFLRSKNITVPNINLDSLIKKKDVKGLLEIVWIIIYHQSISKIYDHGLEGEEALLHWCNTFTEKQFQNISESWDDGKTICHILHHFYPKEIENDFYINIEEQNNTLEYALSCLQKVNIPIMIDYNNFKYMDEKSIIIQYSTIYFSLNSNNDSNNDYNENYYVPNYNSTINDQPNFNCGLIPSSQISELINDEKNIINKINKLFTLKMHPRYPVQIAYIAENIETKELEVIFLHQQFEDVIKRAGPKPIIFVSILGRYQQGKSTINGAITGNIGYKVGDGRKETTNGIHIDGPYDIDYLYQRFKIKIREDIYYKGNDVLSPLVFFFDIEGYDGVMHGSNIEKNNKLFIEMCTPFLCLSSIFILISDSNPSSYEVADFFKRVKVSSLTTYSNNNDSNGALQLNIVINRKNEINDNLRECTKKNIKNAIHQWKENLQKDWNGNEKLTKNGIIYDFSIVSEGLKHYLADGSFYHIFRYFVKNIIRSIEKATEGKFVRGGEKAIELYHKIIQYSNDPNFEENIKLLIRAEHENSYESFAIRAFSKTKYNLFPQIENIFNRYKNEQEFDICIDDILNEYIQKGRNEILKDLSVVLDHPNIASYIVKLEFSIREKIDEKYHQLNNYKNDLLEKYNNLIDQKVEESSSHYLETILKVLSSNHYFNFNINKIESEIDSQIQIFKDDLYNYKKNEKLNLISNQQIDNIIVEKRNYFKSICDNYIQNAKYIAMKVHEENEIKHKMNSLNKKSIEKEYVSCEKKMILNLNNSLGKKKFYSENYKQINKVRLKLQQKIFNLINSKKEDIINQNCTILRQKNEKNSNIINRLTQKNELFIDDNDINICIKTNEINFHSKIYESFSRARIKLAKIKFETRRRIVSLIKVSVETRKTVEYPDGVVNIGEWENIRTENAQFKEILGNIGDGICDSIETVFEFVLDHTEDIKSCFSFVYDIIKIFK